MFNDRLKKLRLALGLNMKQAADGLGMKYTTYVGYEKNEREPNSEVLMQLADFYHCSTDYLIGRTDVEEKNSIKAEDIISERDREHIKKYNSLDLFGKEVVNSVLDIEYRRCTSNQSEKPKEGLILTTIAARSEGNKTKIHTEYVEDLSKYTPDDTDF